MRKYVFLSHKKSHTSDMKDDWRGEKNENV